MGASGGVVVSEANRPSTAPFAPTATRAPEGSTPARTSPAPVMSTGERSCWATTRPSGPRRVTGPASRSGISGVRPGELVDDTPVAESRHELERVLRPDRQRDVASAEVKDSRLDMGRRDVASGRTARPDLHDMCRRCRGDGLPEGRNALSRQAALHAAVTRLQPDRNRQRQCTGNGSGDDPPGSDPPSRGDRSGPRGHGGASPVRRVQGAAP